MSQAPLEVGRCSFYRRARYYWLFGGRLLRFYTQQECEELLNGRQRRKPDSVPELHRERFKYPTEPYRMFAVAHWMATSLTYREPALLWITEWGIWPSSENWHLYYTLRQAYHDQRLLHEAPGHLFVEHEAEDLATFLQVAMLNGWGGYLLPHHNYVSAFFSHDEFVDFFADRKENLVEVGKVLGSGQPAAE
jgi:hypothetical protein